MAYVFDTTANGEWVERYATASLVPPTHAEGGSAWSVAVWKATPDNRNTDRRCSFRARLI